MLKCAHYVNLYTLIRMWAWSGSVCCMIVTMWSAWVVTSLPAYPFSLWDNKIGDAGAAALGDVLKSNISLEEIKWVNWVCLHLCEDLYGLVCLCTENWRGSNSNLFQFAHMSLYCMQCSSVWVHGAHLLPLLLVFTGIMWVMQELRLWQKV